MAAITPAEVKKYARMKDIIVEEEAVTLPATTAGRRLANQYVSDIFLVSTGNETSSTAISTALYKTTTDFNNYTLISQSSDGAITTGGSVYLSYGYSEDNANIADLIPIVTRDVCDYLNNYFEDRVVYVNKYGGLAFVSGSPDTITDDQSDFTTAGFTSGMDIAVRGGSNHGIYTLSGVAAGTLALDTTGEVIDQDQDVTFNSVGGIRISRINWPSALKPYIAQMINYRI
jgi:hypothetical protein